jgi:hypothetical protein
MVSVLVAGDLGIVSLVFGGCVFIVLKLAALVQVLPKESDLDEDRSCRPSLVAHVYQTTPVCYHKVCANFNGLI